MAARYVRVASVNLGQTPLLKDGWPLKELGRELPLTRSGREAVDHAQVIAARAGTARVEPEHLLLGVLSLKNGLAADALQALQERWHRCPCGYQADRDVNAARNLYRLGESRQAPTWPTGGVRCLKRRTCGVTYAVAHAIS